MTKVGLIPIEVEAAYDDYDENETDKFKQTLISCSTTCNKQNEPRIYFMYEALWKKAPVYNNKDYVFFVFSNGEIEKLNYQMIYDMDFTPSYNNYEPYSAHCTTSQYSKYMDYIGSDSMAFFGFDLPGDKNGEEYSKEVEGKYDYSGIKIKIDGYVVVWDENNMKVSVNAYYNHYESDIKINFSSVCIGYKSVSVGIGFEKEKYYHKLGDVNNCICVEKIYK